MNEFNFRRLDNYADRIDGEYNAMIANDETAFRAGRLEQRVLTFPACDGYAYYTVDRIEEGVVHLKHMAVYDAYRDRAIEALDRAVPRTFVEDMLTVQDARRNQLR